MIIFLALIMNVYFRMIVRDAGAQKKEERHLHGDVDYPVIEEDTDQGLGHHSGKGELWKENLCFAFLTKFSLPKVNFIQVML